MVNWVSRLIIVIVGLEPLLVEFHSVTNLPSLSVS